MALKHPSSPHARKLSRTECGTTTAARSPSWRRGLSKTNFLILASLLLYIGHFFRSKAVEKGITTAESINVSHLNVSSIRHDKLPAIKAVNLGPQPEHEFRSPTELVDFLESGSIAVILPVTEGSLPYLRQKLDPILQDHSSISEVSLLAPLTLFPPISKMLRDGRLDMDIEISVAVWPDGLDEGPATIGTVSSLTSEYVLVLGSGGLADLHEESRDLFVTQPFLLDIPTGLCGASFQHGSNHALCVRPFTDTKPVSFVLPPFYMQTTLLRSFNISTEGPNFWIELGKHLVQKDGIGAFIRKSDKSSDRVWCHELCEKFNISTEELTQQQCSANQDDTAQSTSKSSLIDSYAIAMIIPTLDDLRQFSPTACSFARNGYSLNILVFSNDATHATSHDSPFPWIQDHFISGSCELLYSTIHLSSNAFANAEAVDFWLKSSNETASVIVYGVDDYSKGKAEMIAHTVDEQADNGVTIIKIPQVALPFCSWMGTLSLVELRSKSVNFLVFARSRKHRLEYPSYRAVSYHL